jgi:drug/metabolite transporter (DMT)-like permease
LADLVVREGVGYKRRNPWGVFGLTFITLGIYGIVWYYKTNNHLKNYGIDNNPTNAVLAVTLGAFVIVPYFVSYYNTAARIQQAQERSGTSERIIPVLAILLLIVVGPFSLPYYQSQINKAWDAEAEKGADVQPA